MKLSGIYPANTCRVATCIPSFATFAPATCARNMFEANMSSSGPSWRWSSSLSDWDNCDQLQRDDARVWIHVNCIGCAAANRVSSIVLPSRVCASVRVCLPVFVWKSVYAECENKPQAVKNGREKQQHQANHLYRVTTTTTTTTIILRKCAKNPQQKSNQQLKCWICLLFWQIAISHRSRREAARS